jgi:hypothetical protein
MANNIIITPNSASIDFSGSAASSIRLEVDASGSVLFNGNSGSLFSITDNLSGSLMSVNTIAGLPIFEVFSDNNANIGKYNGEAIRVTGSGVDVMLGSGSVMFVSSSKRVGINTTNLTNTLTVAGDISASAITASNVKGYVLQMSSVEEQSHTLGDGAIYYMGEGMDAVNSTGTVRGRLYVPKAGVVKCVFIVGNFQTGAGSNESWPMNLIVNNSTSSSIESVATSSIIRIWKNTNMNVSVAAGDYLTVKSGPVTWATNPICATGNGFSGTIYIE